ncbi:hypothetical protein GJ496_006036 [Pomphorhynchus laevis]|nr:hypothetical protein GJ496_006036 [Pomphorhynchus laevis]
MYKTIRKPKANILNDNRPIVSIITNVSDFASISVRCLHLIHQLDNNKWGDNEIKPVLRELLVEIEKCKNASYDGNKRSSQQSTHRQLILEMLVEYSEQYKFKVQKKQKQTIFTNLRQQEITKLSGTNRNLAKFSNYRNTVESYQLEDALNSRVLTPERRQLLEQENATLQDELIAHTEEISHIEHQVYQVSNLQLAFAEHVFSQRDTIDSVFQNVDKVNTEISEANEYLRKTIADGSSRIFIFIIFVLSFSLLFLNWYNY